MLHIATVHWQNEAWIDIQQRYLKKHIREPFRIYAFLNGIPESYRGRFYYSSTEPIKDHAVKLNLLAEVIQSSTSDDNDLVMFLDGDAFPISGIMPTLVETLSTHPLVAVQRLENNGDKQPHPCFCVTTVGFWKAIGGDWREGYAWNDAAGNPTTDVGGNLLGILEDRKIAWVPLHRSNRTNLHPLWFGIYGDRVYHHGAGFRDAKLSRADLKALADARSGWSSLRRGAARLFDYGLSKSPIRSLRTVTSLQKAIRRNGILSEQFFEKVKNDEQFYRELMA
jgi:hypothetical protein